MQRQVNLPEPASSEGKLAISLLFWCKIGRVIAFKVRTIALLHPKGSEKLRQSGHNLPQPATAIAWPSDQAPCQSLHPRRVCLSRPCPISSFLVA